MRSSPGVSARRRLVIVQSCDRGPDRLPRKVKRQASRQVLRQLSTVVRARPPMRQYAETQGVAGRPAYRAGACPQSRAPERTGCGVQTRVSRRLIVTVPTGRATASVSPERSRRGRTWSCTTADRVLQPAHERIGPPWLLEL